jgi:hypothetical protein
MACGRQAWLWLILAAFVLAGCSTAPAAIPATTTTAPVENAQSAIRAGCQHLPQVKQEALQALDSTHTVAQLKSMTSRAAWKAVSGIGLAAGISGKYHRFVVDGAELNNGYAAAISGGPTEALSSGLLTLSADCQREGQAAGQ